MRFGHLRVMRYRVLRVCCWDPLFNLQSLRFVLLESEFEMVRVFEQSIGLISRLLNKLGYLNDVPLLLRNRSIANGPSLVCLADIYNIQMIINPRFRSV